MKDRLRHSREADDRVCLGRARASRRPPAPTSWSVSPTTCQDVPGDRRAVLRRHERRGPHRGPDHDPLGLPRPDDDPRPQPDRARRHGGGGARRPCHALDLSGPGAGDHGFAAGRRRVRRLHRPRRAGVPAGQRLHRRQRAEQGALLAAAVQRESHGGSLCRVRAASGGVLRRAEGRRPEHHGDRRRPGAAGKRQSVRDGQPLDLPAALHPRHGPRLSREQARSGRSWTSSVSTPTRTPRRTARDRATPGPTRAFRTSRASSRLSGMRSSARPSRPSRKRECLAGQCGR